MRRPILYLLCAAVAISFAPQVGSAHPEPPHLVIEEVTAIPGPPTSASLIVRLDECQGCGTLVQSTGFRLKPTAACVAGSCSPGVMSSGVDLVANDFTLPLATTGAQLVPSGPSGLTGPNLTPAPWIDVQYGTGVGVQVWASGVNKTVPICVSTIGSNFGLCGGPY